MFKFTAVKDYQLARMGAPVQLSTPQAASGVDLRPIMPPVVNQGAIGSCTANAWAYMLGSLAIKGDQTHHKNSLSLRGGFMPLSRLFIYYNERTIMGTESTDSGATLTAGMQAVQAWGVCSEQLWPYWESMEFTKPYSWTYHFAKDHRVPTGTQLDNSHLPTLKGFLDQGYPFVFGVTIYDSFRHVNSSGLVLMPKPQSEKALGGHALCCAGYDDSKQAFIVANSWGTDFGDKGYCYIPYEYLTNTELAWDFWTLRV